MCAEICLLMNYIIIIVKILLQLVIVIKIQNIFYVCNNNTEYNINYVTIPQAEITFQFKTVNRIIDERCAIAFMAII